MTYVCFFCFESMSEFTVMDGIFVMTLGGIGMVMPTPSGMGSYHIAAMFALGMLSVNDFTLNIFTTPPHQDQITFAFLVHTAQTIMILFMGFLGLILLNAKNINPTTFIGLLFVGIILFVFNSVIISQVINEWEDTGQIQEWIDDGVIKIDNWKTYRY